MGKVIDDTGNGGVTEKVFFDVERELDSLERQSASLRAKRGALKKRATDDGIDWDDFIWSRKQRAKPAAEQLRSEQRRLAYRKFLRLSVADVMTVGTEIVDETGLTDEQRHKKWSDEGYVIGISGKSMDLNPHDPNSIAGRMWIEGWREGQAKLGEKIKKKNEAEAAAASGKTPSEKSAAGVAALKEGAGSATVTPITEGKRGRGRPKKQPEEAAKPPVDDSPVQTAGAIADAPAGGVTDDEWAAAGPKDGDPADPLPKQDEEEDPFSDTPAPPPGAKH